MRPLRARITPPQNINPAWIKGDRRWFVKHKRRSHRVRPLAAGEVVELTDPGKSMPPLKDGWKRYVIVRQVKPGVRVRVPVDVTGQMLHQLQSEEYLRALFDIVMQDPIATHEAVMERARLYSDAGRRAH